MGGIFGNIPSDGVTVMGQIGGKYLLMGDPLEDRLLM